MLRVVERDERVDMQVRTPLGWVQHLVEHWLVPLLLRPKTERREGGRTTEMEPKKRQNNMLENRHVPRNASKNIYKKITQCVSQLLSSR